MVLMVNALALVLVLRVNVLVLVLVLIVTVLLVSLMTPGNKLCKFADDTYLVIRAMNVNTRVIELENMWSRKNNLTLNRPKSNEIIFTDSKKRHQIQEPSKEMDIARVTSIKI